MEKSNTGFSTSYLHVLRKLTKNEKKYLATTVKLEQMVTRLLFNSMVVISVLSMAMMGFFLVKASASERTAILIGTVLLFLVFAWLFYFLRKHRTRLPEFSDVVSLQGEFRSETKTIGVTGEARSNIYLYYIGDTLVSVPNHWLTIGFLEEGKTYNCECSFISLPGVRPGASGTFYNTFSVLSVDDTYAIDREYGIESSYDQVKAIRNSFLSPTLALVFIVFTVFYVASENNPIKLYDYLTKALPTQDKKYEYSDLLQESLVEGQIVNLEHLFVVHELFEENVHIIENRELFLKEFGEFKDGLEKRIAQLKVLGSVNPLRLYKDERWERFDRIRNNTPFQELKTRILEKLANYQSPIQAIEKKYKSFDSWHLGPRVRNIRNQSRKVIYASLDDIYLWERNNFMTEVKRFPNSFYSKRVQLTGIRQVKALPSMARLGREKTYRFGPGLLTKYLEELTVFLQKNKAITVTGIAEVVNYDDNGELSELVINASPSDQYDVTALSILMAVFLFLAVVTAPFGYQSIKAKKRFRNHLKKIEALYTA